MLQQKWESQTYYSCGRRTTCQEDKRILKTTTMLHIAHTKTLLKICSLFGGVWVPPNSTRYLLPPTSTEIT